MGRGMDTSLECNLLGDDNCAILDGGVLSDSSECRKSIHKQWLKKSNKPIIMGR